MYARSEHKNICEFTFIIKHYSTQSRLFTNESSIKTDLRGDAAAMIIILHHHKKVTMCGIDDGEATACVMEIGATRLGRPCVYFGSTKVRRWWNPKTVGWKIMQIPMSINPRKSFPNRIGIKFDLSRTFHLSYDSADDVSARAGADKNLRGRCQISRARPVLPDANLTELLNNFYYFAAFTFTCALAIIFSSPHSTAAVNAYGWSVRYHVDLHFWAVRRTGSRSDRGVGRNCAKRKRKQFRSC